MRDPPLVGWHKFISGSDILRVGRCVCLNGWAAPTHHPSAILHTLRGSSTSTSTGSRVAARPKDGTTHTHIRAALQGGMGYAGEKYFELKVTDHSYCFLVILTHPHAQLKISLFLEKARKIYDWTKFE